MAKAAAFRSYGQYGALVESYARAIRARNLAPNSVKTYLALLGRFGAFLLEREMPTDVDAIGREHVERFLGGLVAAGHRPAGIATRFAALKIFFAWLVDEGEIGTSPMAKMKKPLIPEEPPAILTDAQLGALVKACQGKAFADRRAMAVVRLLLDTGLRVSELAGLRVEDVDWDRGVVAVVGKGRRPRQVPFGAKAAAALDRYHRDRAKHKLAAATDFWLGHLGPLGPDGVRDLVRERARLAGIERRVWPHLLRHQFSHAYLTAGGQEANLMKIAGWRNARQLQRYGASAAVERAIAEHRRLSPGDRI